MTESRQVLPFIFGLVGGVLIVTGGALFLFAFSRFDSFFPFVGINALLAVVAGVLVIIAAALVHRQPEAGLTWGIVMIVFGSVSVVGMGGFVVGMILAIVAGALAILWSEPGAGGARACTACGRLFSAGFPHCPYCGQAVPGEI